VLLFENVGRGSFRAPVAVKSLDDPSLAELIGQEAADTLRTEVELLEGAGEPFTREKFLQGKQTPVYFGSALTNFGVEPFLDSFAALCPMPGPQLAGDVLVEPTDQRFSGFVFKIQANMDPAQLSCASARAVSAATWRCTTSASARRSGSSARRASSARSAKRSTRPGRAT
jgi:peptide chain release factor 3